jgi:hypothetical protein
MPSIIDEMRERRQWEEPKASNPVPIILATMAAFAIGGVAAFGYLKMPTLGAVATKPAQSSPGSAPEQPKSEVSFAGVRLGRAETAPLLKSCVPMHKLGFGGGFGDRSDRKGLEPADIYPILQMAGTASTIAAIAGVKQQAVQETSFAGLWGEVADCVYRQNGWALCDPDNRALAVEAVNTLVRQVNTATSSLKSEASAPKQSGGPQTFGQVKAELDGRSAPNPQHQLAAARAVKDRVLSGLRNRANEGRLIASDFGFFAPAEVLQVFKDIKPTRNACAEKQ